MKITTFNTQIVTKDSETVAALFEELGFERRHSKHNISDQNISAVRMKNEGGFYVDVAQGDFDLDRAIIRMNVDDLEEALAILEKHGFKRSNKLGDNNETATSRFAVMIAPTGFVINVIQHIKKS